MHSFGAFLARYPGVSRERLLRAAGIGPQELEDPDSPLTQQAVVALIETAARETGDFAIGVAFAEQLPWKDLGVLAYVMLHAPTIGAALANSCRYFTIQATAGRANLSVDGDEARLEYRIDDPAIESHPQHSEGTLALFTRICREASAEWAPREMWFTHRPPVSTAAQQRFFRCPLHYARSENAMVLGASDLRRPLRTADPGLLPILLRHADECLAKIPTADTFQSDVRRLVISSLASGDATIEHVASKLGMSARSIQRRLQTDGGSFKQCVEEARVALSQQYVSDPAITLTEAAFLLGYSDLSAFSRAFRRWMGKSAIEFRREATR